MRMRCDKIARVNAMNFLRQNARLALRWGIVALVFAALSPTIATWRAQSQPILLGEICTAMGFVKVAADGTSVPATPAKHAPHCAWCLSPGTWLALSGEPQLALPAPEARAYPAPAVAFDFLPQRPHTLAWAQAPPVLS